MSRLIEDYEDQSFHVHDSPPYRTLQFLMGQNDLRQSDLVSIFGSRGRVSEVVNGKRAISKAQAKALGEFFKISSELFIFLCAGYSTHNRFILGGEECASQHVINAIAKVSAVYTRDSNKWHQFKPHSSLRCDAKSMTIGSDCQTVSLAICPKGRIIGQLQMSARMCEQLQQGELGSAELVYRKGNFYLHISITIPAPEVKQSQGSLGVDLGFNRVAVTSDNKFHTAKNIRHKKSGYKRTRRSLQANGSKSAKRALQRVSGRERRFVTDTNHCVSKQIVADAKANNQRIVLEDLGGIRETGKAKCVHEWSFAQLQWMIRYKAARAGVEVVYIDSRYTSQTCSRCLHLGVRPNQSSFQCRDCGYRINADLNGAKSIALRHDLVAMGRYFCEYLRNEVNRPGAVRSSEKKRQVRNLKPQAPSIARPRA